MKTGLTNVGAISAHEMKEFPTLPASRAVELQAISGSHPFGAALAARHAVNLGCGSGFRDFVVFQPDFRFAYSRFTLGSQSTGLCEGQGLLKLHFSLAGRNTLRYKGANDLVVRAGCLFVSVQPRGIDKLDCHPAHVLEHSLTITCRASFLTDTLQLEPTMWPPALNRFAAGNAPELFCQSLPLPNHVIRVIEDLLSPVYNSRFAHIHARTRAIDLACLALDLLIGAPTKAGMRFSPQDRRGFELVREHLSSNFLHPTSIAQLAFRVGMNHTKLTCGFRVLFGETINQYLTRLRMGHALQMLANGFSCSAVAADLGYRHQSSFTTAFRAHFGRAPKQSRSSRIPADLARSGILPN